MEAVTTSPIRGSLSLKVKRSVGPSRGKGASTQSAVKLVAGISEVGTSMQAAGQGMRHSDSGKGNRSSSSRGRRRRSTWR